MAKFKTCANSRNLSGFFVVLLVLSLLSACIGYYVLRRNPSAEPTLRFVSIIHRHGERSPQKSYPLDPYKGESFWPEGPNALTQKGKVGLHQLGHFLRQRYDGYLSTKYSPNEIFVVSSDSDRCLMSASIVLAGLYPPVGIQIWNPDLKWQPIPIHTTPIKYDDKITVWARHDCPLLAKEEADWVSIGQKKLDDNKEFISYITKQTGGYEIRDIYDVYYLYDNLLVAQQQGLPVPEWAHGANWDKLESLANIYTLYLFMSPTKIKLYSGVLIEEILSNMRRKASLAENFERRVNLYSAHDENIVRLWRGMKFTPEITERPSYGATLMFELHEIKGKYRVKIIYKKSYLDENLTVLKMQGCKELPASEDDEMCDLETFASALESVTIKNFDKECEIH